MPRPRRVRALLAVVLVAGTVSACRAEPPPPPPDSREYVALGDSYAAAPQLPGGNLSVPCKRSDANYPAVLAEELTPVTLDDVSCVGAMTAHMTGKHGSMPPQLDALSADTDLVTITIGGNDKGLFPSWYACRGFTEPGGRGSPCADANGDSLFRLMPQIQRNVSAVLDEIKRRAPDAVVVVAPYPRVFPGGGRTCKLASAYATDDHAYINSLIKSLSDALIAAAKEAGAAWVDVYATSRGHDICSDEPWVNGITDDQTRATALHPFPEAQAAVAALILEKLVLD